MSPASQEAGCHFNRPIPANHAGTSHAKDYDSHHTDPVFRSRGGGDSQRCDRVEPGGPQRKEGRGIPVTVIPPDAYPQSADTRFPVAYALHGAGGDRALRALADRWQVIVVCPDGGLTSWWLDSPIAPAYQYETFVAKELIAFTDQRYRTMAAR